MGFSQRTNSYGIYNDYKWYSQSPFYPGSQMPNCTAYAYGRFWEIIGSKPNGLPLSDAGQWYDQVITFQKGQTPRLGAVICWHDPKKVYKGHVAIVEKINPDNSIVISESGWISDNDLTRMTGVNCNRAAGILPAIVSDTTIVNWYWKTDTLTPSTGYRANWQISRGYQLKGFIYPPNTSGIVPPSEWEYDINNTTYWNLTDEQQKNNAVLAMLQLSALGWTLESICGMLGNAMYESTGLNPGQVEIGFPLPSTIYGTTAGLGLIGFTAYLRDDSPGRWPNPLMWYADHVGGNWYDGKIQIDLIDKMDDPVIKYLGTNAVLWNWNREGPNYYANLNEYKINSRGLTVEELADEYLRCAENPGNPDASVGQRMFYARQWYNYLKNIDPGTIGPPYPNNKNKNMPIWTMIRYH